MADPAKPTLGNNTNTNVPMTPPTTPAKATFSPGPAIPDAMPASTSTQQVEPPNDSTSGGLTPEYGPSANPKSETAITMDEEASTECTSSPKLDQIDPRRNPEAYWAAISKAEQDALLIKMFGTSDPWAYEHDLPMDDGEPDLDYEFGSDRHQTEPWSQEEEEKWNFEMYGTKESPPYDCGEWEVGSLSVKNEHQSRQY